MGLWATQKASLSEQLAREIEAFGRKLRLDIQMKLFRGELIAYGYPAPRHPDDLPRKIDGKIAISGRIAWEESTIRWEGLEYFGVRVFLPECSIATNKTAPR